MCEVVAVKFIGYIFNSLLNASTKAACDASESELNDFGCSNMFSTHNTHKQSLRRCMFIWQFM